MDSQDWDLRKTEAFTRHVHPEVTQKKKKKKKSKVSFLLPWSLAAQQKRGSKMLQAIIGRRKVIFEYVTSPKFIKIRCLIITTKNECTTLPSCAVPRFTVPLFLLLLTDVPKQCWHWSSNSTSTSWRLTWSKPKVSIPIRIEEIFVSALISLTITIWMRRRNGHQVIVHNTLPFLLSSVVCWHFH